MVNDLLKNKYYLLTNPNEPEPTLVYYYYNQDEKCNGFGFNIADGGGFIPESDISKETQIIDALIFKKVQ